MLHTFTVEESTLVLLKRLQQMPALSDLRLETEGVRMATLQDIAAMKIHAITGRGRKADADPMPKMFIDVGWDKMKSTIRNAIENY